MPAFAYTSWWTACPAAAAFFAAAGVVHGGLLASSTSVCPGDCYAPVNGCPAADACLLVSYSVWIGFSCILLFFHGL
jgi:hypothetical protein